MHIKHMTKKKVQLRNESWFLNWLEQKVKFVKRHTKNKKEFRAQMLHNISMVEKITGQKL